MQFEDIASYEDLFSPEEWDTLTGHRDTTSHAVTINSPPGEFEGNENRYELDCDSCGHIGAVDKFQCAEAVARLHEEFVAVLVLSYEVPNDESKAPKGMNSPIGPLPDLRWR
jgi:hypothetical protein